MMHIDYSKDDLGKLVSIDEITKGQKLYDFAMDRRNVMVE